MSIKQDLWLTYYLDSTDPVSFLNGVGACKRAGYKGTYGSIRTISWKNFKHFRPQIDKWLEEQGYGETTLKKKLSLLLEAQQTQILKVKGEVTEIPEGVQIVGKTNEETVLAIGLEAVETQRRALDMALKVRGMYAAQNVHVTGLEDLAERMAKANQRVNDKGGE